MEIKFLADKVYAHHWPLDTQKWDDLTRKRIDQDLNTNKEKKQILVKSATIMINNYEFKLIKKVGLTYRYFKNKARWSLKVILKNFMLMCILQQKKKTILKFSTNLYIGDQNIFQTVCCLRFYFNM